VNKLKLILQGLPAALLVLSAAISICAQDQGDAKHNARPQETATATKVVKNESTAADVKYTYEFSQPKFVISHIVIEHDASGRGTVTFKRLNEDIPVVEPLSLSTAALERITSAWRGLQFLDSNTDYQAEKQFPHLGTMKIGMQQGERKRVAEFNWTNNNSASTLVNEYRKAADQAILIFDISIARENQPLNAPKLMEAMESYLKRDALSDPQQLLKLLQEMSTDEHIPLIARNHALRLIKKIQK
jgi:nucleotidyltransferase/DNA polymerase involved in DNA repair